MDYKHIPKRKDLYDLIMVGTIDHTFPIETATGTHKIRMALLLEGEDTECQMIAGREASPYDIITRDKIYRREVLARAILDIDGQSFPEDEKIKILREFYNCLQGPIAAEFWAKYLELRTIQQMQLGKEAEGELKNSSGSPKS